MRNRNKDTGKGMDFSTVRESYIRICKINHPAKSAVSAQIKVRKDETNIALFLRTNIGVAQSSIGYR